MQPKYGDLKEILLLFRENCNRLTPSCGEMRSTSDVLEHLSNFDYIFLAGKWRVDYQLSDPT